jgi:flagellar P-ring protein precursor FlgI
MIRLIFIIIFTCLPFTTNSSEGVRLKDLTRFDGIREISLTGYGVVVGLSGTGDSQRHKPTLQSVKNALRKFGVDISENQLSSRNVASVVVTATLPPFSEVGDKIDVTVSSLGDARSLQGGALLITPLSIPGGGYYALAQGQVSTGSFRFDSSGNVVQKNHPTVGIVSDGAIVEKRVDTSLQGENGQISLVLKSPDITTAWKIETVINQHFTADISKAVSAGRVEITPENSTINLYGFLSELESLRVQPDSMARVIINERTGTIVSGGDVILEAASIAHGSLRLNISSNFDYQGPEVIVGRNVDLSANVVRQTELSVNEEAGENMNVSAGTRLDDVVTALRKLSLTTRDIIVVLQALKRANVLHAELIVQ